MARNQSGGFNKFLNFIGLVDDDRSENRVDEYGSGDYGRQSAYTPSRQRSGASSSSGRRSIPAQGSRSNYGSSGSRRSYADEDSRYSSSRRSGRFEDANQDFAPQQRPTRSRSRFEENDESVETMPVPAQPQRPGRNTGRTVMFSLANLKDANMVITALVKGNTIVMTIDTEDEHLKERIVDTLSGAVFALDATIRKASYQTYLLAPKSVNVRAAYEVDDQF